MKELDREIFLMLNNDLGDTADTIFVFLSSNFSFAIMAVIALIIIFLKFGKKEGFMALGAMLLMILLADQAANFFKISIQKFRPIYTVGVQEICHYVAANIPSSLYGTVSGHAANSIGLALLTSLMVKNRFYTFLAFILALLICYSRIYLAVHFPMDLLLGSVVGIIAALICYCVYSFAVTHIGRKKNIYKFR